MMIPPATSEDLVLGTVDTNDPRDRSIPVRLTPEQQGYHTAVWGMSGLGKSVLLRIVFLMLLRQGKTVGLIDPAGDLSQSVLHTLVAKGYFRTPDAYKQLVYIDFANGAITPLNVLSGTTAPHSTALHLLDAMTRVWPELHDAPAFTELFVSSVMVLMANALPLTALSRLLTDDGFRKECLTSGVVLDPNVQATFAMYDKLGRDQAQTAGSTLRRAFQLSFSPLLRQMLEQPDNVLRFRAFADAGVSYILNLGGVTEQHTRRLITALSMVQIEQAFLSRVDLDPSLRRECVLLIDEWISVAGQAQTLGNLLDQLRKYGLRLWLAGQSIGAVNSDRLTAALENCKTVISFGLGRESAEIQARQLATFDPYVVKEPTYAAGSHSLYFSIQEQLEGWTNAIQHLPKGICFVKVHNQPPIRTRVLNAPEDTPDPAELQEVLDTYRQMYQRVPQRLDVPSEDEDESRTRAYQRLFRT
ncbi:MAG: type IV secretory system conjugative DNA transfer family protein [Chloroflexota bacterium]